MTKISDALTSARAHIQALPFTEERADIIRKIDAALLVVSSKDEHSAAAENDFMLSYIKTVVDAGPVVAPANLADARPHPHDFNGPPRE